MMSVEGGRRERRTLEGCSRRGDMQTTRVLERDEEGREETRSSSSRRGEVIKRTSRDSPSLWKNLLGGIKGEDGGGI